MTDVCCRMHHSFTTHRSLALPAKSDDGDLTRADERSCMQAANAADIGHSESAICKICIAQAIGLGQSLQTCHLSRQLCDGLILDVLDVGHLQLKDSCNYNLRSYGSLLPDLDSMSSFHGQASSLCILAVRKMNDQPCHISSAWPRLAYDLSHVQAAACVTCNVHVVRHDRLCRGQFSPSCAAQHSNCHQQQRSMPCCKDVHACHKPVGSRHCYSQVVALVQQQRCPVLRQSAVHLGVLLQRHRERLCKTRHCIIHAARHVWLALVLHEAMLRALCCAGAPITQHSGAFVRVKHSNQGKKDGRAQILRSCAASTHAASLHMFAYPGIQGHQHGAAASCRAKPQHATNALRK